MEITLTPKAQPKEVGWYIFRDPSGVPRLAHVYYRNGCLHVLSSFGAVPMLEMNPVIRWSEKLDFVDGQVDYIVPVKKVNNIEHFKE